MNKGMIFCFILVAILFQFIMPDSVCALTPLEKKILDDYQKNEIIGEAYGKKFTRGELRELETVHKSLEAFKLAGDFTNIKLHPSYSKITTYYIQMLVEQKFYIHLYRTGMFGESALRAALKDVSERTRRLVVLEKNNQLLYEQFIGQKNLAGIYERENAKLKKELVLAKSAPRKEIKQGSISQKTTPRNTKKQKIMPKLAEKVKRFEYVDNLVWVKKSRGQILISNAKPNGSADYFIARSSYTREISKITCYKGSSITTFYTNAADPKAAFQHYMN